MAGIHKKLNGLFHKKKSSRLPSLVLLGIGILAIAASGYLIFSTPVFTPVATAILPGQGIILYAESDRADCSDAFTRKAPKTCKAREEYLSALIGEFPKRINTFADHIAIAVYKNPAGNTVPLAPVIAFRVTNSRAAEHYLRSMSGFTTATEEIRDGTRILNFTEPRSRSIFFWKGWLFFSAEPTLVDRLVAVRNTESHSIEESLLYNALANKLPAQSNIRVLAESQGLSRWLPAAAAPLIDFIPQIGIGITEQTERLVIDVIATSPKLPQRANTATGNDVDLQKLISSLPDNDFVIFGAIRNFKQELDWTLSYLESTDPAFALFINGQTKKFLTKFFGNGISLEKDILPLLENEIAFTVSESSADPKYAFLLATDTKDREFAEAKQEKFLTAMKNAAASFVPRILEHTLEDGTVVKEVAACTDCVRQESERVGRGTLNRFIASDQEESVHSLALGIIDNIFVASNDNQKAKSFLESHQKLGSKTPVYLLEIKDFKNQDEVFVVKPSALTGIAPKAAEYLTDFATLVFARENGDNMWHLKVKANYAY